jgi:hypothetical protein
MAHAVPAPRIFLELQSDFSRHVRGTLEGCRGLGVRQAPGLVRGSSPTPGTTNRRAPRGLDGPGFLLPSAGAWTVHRWARGQHDPRIARSVRDGCTDVLVLVERLDGSNADRAAHAADTSNRGRSLRPAGLSTSARTNAGMGIEHILTGVDHPAVRASRLISSTRSWRWKLVKPSTVVHRPRTVSRSPRATLRVRAHVALQIGRTRR